MKNMKNIIIVALVLVMLLSCTGCTSSETGEPVNIVFVVTIADDETKVNSGIDELSALPAQPGSDYAFISAQGVPACIGEPGTIVDFSDRGYTDDMMDRARASIKADLAARLDSYHPTSAEIDMARAIELSVHQLNANAVDGRKNILVVYGSGRSSTGLINLVETPIYKVDIETSVTTIVQNMGVDMSKVDEVIWYCIGECGGDQPALSSAEKGKLQDFYEQLFIALGMDPDHILFKSNLPSNECYQFEDTPVSCMAVEGTVSGLQELVVLEPDTFENADKTTLQEPIVIPETKVQYLPDSAEFADPSAAAEAIQPVADFLLDYPDLSLVIYSTVAGDTDCEWLSTARSEKVKSVLTAAGIDESRIIVVYVKVADDIFYKFGLGTGAEASVNRKTVLVCAESPFGQQILANAQ